ncbi:heme exporter protein CcmD [Methylomonas sp. EFPC3]|uniref:heme exporter protein CcmD n=1 Tax=Methylomonas TaxID=416 RepID=UPI00112BFB6B|nr:MULTISPECIES: heme exporter protein CcmD [Methylomonas]TPQ29890.1 heme exporter protein CcmD [Methylomonas koyamae]WFP51489.1 heme exporter protein CcmD [Methylomonas sp. EFPC3]
MSWDSFWYMGGYAAYVWPAYGVTALVLAANLVWPVWQRKQLFRQLAIKQKRAQSK